MKNIIKSDVFPLNSIQREYDTLMAEADAAKAAAAALDDKDPNKLAAVKAADALKATAEAMTGGRRRGRKSRKAKKSKKATRKSKKSTRKAKKSKKSRKSKGRK